MSTAPKDHRRTDRQVTSLAGELFVAAELLKRDLQASITFGNAKAVDLLAYNPRIGRTFSVQVKSVRRRNSYWLDPKKIDPHHVYVFVILNAPGTPPDFFVVPGRTFVEAPERFGKDFQRVNGPGVHPRDLADFKDAWSVFDSH